MTKGGREKGKRQNVLWDWRVEWESMKYKGKRPCARFAQLFVVCLSGTCSDTYHFGDELSKCSLKYEPSVFTKQAS